MVILRLTAVTGAEYEWSQHEADSRAVGLVEFDIEAAREGRTDGLDIALRLALEVGESVARAPARPANLLTRCLRWFGEEETVELVVATGYYLILSRCMVSFRLQPEEAFGHALADSAGRAGRRGYVMTLSDDQKAAGDVHWLLGKIEAIQNLFVRHLSIRIAIIIVVVIVVSVIVAILIVVEIFGHVLSLFA